MYHSFCDKIHWLSQKAFPKSPAAVDSDSVNQLRGGRKVSHRMNSNMAAQTGGAAESQDEVTVESD